MINIFCIGRAALRVVGGFRLQPDQGTGVINCFCCFTERNYDDDDDRGGRFKHPESVYFSITH